MTKTLESAVLLLSILLLFSGIRNNNVADRDYRVEKTSNTIVDCGSPVSQTDSQKDILTNDNRVPAGRLVNGILYLNLEVRAGNWYPESKQN